jgi:hypothetical protein
VAQTETVIAGRNLMTPHPSDCYPGLRVVRPGPGWAMGIIVPEDGQTIVATGGEKVYAYETVNAVRADAFELRAGDRATLVRSDLPAFLVEWRIERAARPDYGDGPAIT